MKIQFSLDEDLLLKKTLRLYNMLVIVRTVFLKAKNTIQKFF